MRIIGEGTIEKVGKNRYRVRHNLGKDRTTGQYIRSSWRTVRGTKTDAIAAREQYRQELEGGMRLDAEGITFAEYARIFSDNRKATGALAPSTLDNDRLIVKYLNSYIGDMLLSELDALSIEKMLATHSEKNNASADQVRRMYRKLKQILEDACNKDYLLRNPCNKVRAPKAPKPHLHYLTRTEAIRFMKALEEEAENVEKYRPDYARRTLNHSRIMAVRLAMATGMRRGEVLGLTWGCVGFETKNLRVAQQMTVDGIRPPKTDAGHRIIALDEEVLKRLKGWKAEQLAFLNYHNSKQEADDTQGACKGHSFMQSADAPVITNEIGGWCNPDNFNRWWYRFIKKYGFEGLRFHDLRHTQATLLIAQGVDIKTVQNRLGHTLASTTLDLYAGIIPGNDQQAASIMGRLLTATPAPYSNVVNM